jgi:hypothetical protein
MEADKESEKLSRTQKMINLFRQRFIQRDDCFPLQFKDNGGGYTVVGEKLTDEIILSHLRGDKTIGLYCSSDSMSKWLCIDIDDLEEAAVREVQNHARRFGISFLTEFSGKKGYHLWVFFDRPYPNRFARALSRAFAFNNEVFPKQDFITSGKLGSLVKAPLGIHQLTGNRCLFLDKDLKPEKDQFEVLASVTTVNPIHILKSSFPEIWKQMNSYRQDKGAHSSGFTTISLPIIKDCVRIAILKGAREGNRNQTGHIIASELRRLGIERKQAEIILKSIWNPQNEPVLEDREIQIILSSAFDNKEYSYGCREGGTLRRILNCVSTQKCRYLTALISYYKKENKL